MTAIRKHLTDLVAVAALIVVALAVTAYIVEEQRLRLGRRERSDVLAAADDDIVVEAAPRQPGSDVADDHDFDAVSSQRGWFKGSQQTYYRGQNKQSYTENVVSLLFTYRIWFPLFQSLQICRKLV